jgi:putative salt-induced outer membrane protein YdiY
MHGGVIRVDTGTEIVEFPRDALFSMIEGEPRELNYWSLDIDVGLTLRSGNSDQSDLTTEFEIDRESPLTKLILKFQSAYSVVEDEEITDNQRFAGLFEVYVSQRVFLLAPLAEAYRDRIQNIDLRSTLGGGVGYDLIDRPKIEWNVLGGAGYQRTDFDTVEVGEDDSSDDAALIFRTALELDPISDVDWDTTYQLALVVTDFDQTSQHLESEFSVEVWGPLDLDVDFVWDRIQAPTADSSGDVPESDDFRLTVGFSLEIE